jgi:diguanylate cyclase (GGDEF)-like protein
MTAGSSVQEAVRAQSEEGSAAEQPFASPPRPFLLLVANAFLGVAVIAAIFVTHLRGEYTVAFLTAVTALAALEILAFASVYVSRRRLEESQRRYQARLFIRNLELQDMAMRDDLTQLFNRRYFYNRLERELDQARKFQRPLAVVVLDVDRLKAVNDTYGHKAGDLLLATMGRLLVQHTRTCDLPARIGGDEFGIVMPETDKSAAFAVANRLQRALESASVFEEGGKQLKLHISLGVSGYPWGGDDVDAIVQWADTYMYAAKTVHRDETNAPPRKTHRSRSRQRTGSRSAAGDAHDGL